MYTIHADDELIYDSTLEDYKIGKGEITKETDKAGSFVFSLYSDHFYYDRFVKLKTVVMVRKSGRITFRGRPLDDGADYMNCKTFTCEGELGFLQDSIIRPYSKSGTPEELFRWYIEQHNAQVDAFKRFKVGTCTVVDPNGYIARENTGYESTLSNLKSRLLEDATGGHFFITHGDDGTDPVPTIHYLADFTKVASQPIEFGVNLRDFTKKTKSTDIATAIIPLGAAVDDGDTETEDAKLTIASVNNGQDYVYSAKGVALYGWVYKAVPWDDVKDPAILKAKAEAYVEESINQAITIELTAVDLHALDRSIESYGVCEYIPVISPPHNFNDVLLCNKQTMNLLKPGNDTVTLGHTFTTFTEQSARNASNLSVLSNMQNWSKRLSNAAASLNQTITRLDALYAAGYLTITVTATDSGGEVEELLETSGALTVNGQRITKKTATIAVAAGNVEVIYTPLIDLATARTVAVNGVAMGTAQAVGVSISATLSDVTDGSTLAVVFTA